MRVLRRLAILLVLFMVPVYLVSLAETLETPQQWRDIAVGDSHAQVRAKLRASGLHDAQCDWVPALQSVRCTLLGRHHAGGVAVRFDGRTQTSRVTEVKVHEPIFTGPFHLHVRLRRWFQ
ncbi:hypothetical protein [Thiosocius teredinicola]|uniref:hypothetical protein n=1 Tax=Thiosocius teredinicola TaxID=1973002 RepID=UPI000F77F809